MATYAQLTRNSHIRLGSCKRPLECNQLLPPTESHRDICTGFAIVISCLDRGQSDSRVIFNNEYIWILSINKRLPELNAFSCVMENHRLSLSLGQDPLKQMRTYNRITHCRNGCIRPLVELGKSVYLILVVCCQTLRRNGL